jgi:hypothetical protein
MRDYFLLLFLFFASLCALGQKQDCLFSRDSIIKPDQTLTKQLVKTIADIKLISCYETAKIPRFVLNAFKCWSWNNKWTIAEPDGDFNVGCDIKENLPNRQLKYIGLNEHYMLIAYKYGGGDFSNCPVMLFRFDNEKIISVMYWISNSDRINTKKKVIRSLACLDPYGIECI